MTLSSKRSSGASGRLRLHPLSLSLALAGLLAGCGGGESTDPAVQASRVNGSTGAAGSTSAGTTAAAAAAQICFFEHVNYVGASTCLTASSSWIGSSWNDRISSLKVPAGYKVELFSDINYGGRVLTLTADNANLVPSNFNDVVSSVRITATSTVKLASVQFAQSMLYGSSDNQLVLVANKPTLLKVNVTAPASPATLPAATVRIENTATGTSRDLPLAAPRRGLPTTVSDVPSFDDAYTVTVPADLVKTGMKVTVNVAGAAAQSFTPRVGGGIPMRFMPIAVKIAGTTGQLPVDQTAHIKALFPVSTVTLQAHPTYVSTRVTTLPTSDAQWSDAFGKILGELSDLHALERAARHDYYFGFIPKRTWGLAGLGYVPGNSAVSFDMPNAPDTVRDVVAHELGHNFSLPHAACGGAGSPDPKYPYPDANLGKAGRYIWSYLSDTNSFYDPRPTDRHDIMSYCGGVVFSDYNYRLMQTFLTPTDAATAKAAAVAAAPDQDVLLISGSIRGKQIEINPVKTLVSKPESSSGPYVVRVQTSAGQIQDYAFTPQSLDHEGELLHFRVLVPKVDNIASISVMRDGSTLAQAAARASNARQKALAAGASRAQVQVQETRGQAVLRWDADATPFLSVTWTDGTRRLNLAQDLQGGQATLDTSELPAGGRFELVVSDGLNAQRVEQAR
ncbi:peptidase inhibitor family I36 protein [Roseateles amylovorans]|uniref:Peptidase inhibitor family I36 protein n=1 Tax=Roseateles amylovorans TaxID=2978473 RepID=A0ABY6B164_9BURK|nr:peptidase inhibitor family I36 protein [Roseateles amylovorans]UXH79142.1 peptidase inhibitor family I36 protein [Roseateles amylovorans]